jgi:hypothetical protein
MSAQFILQPPKLPDLTPYVDLPLFYFLGPRRGGGLWYLDLFEEFSRQCTGGFIAAMPYHFPYNNSLPARHKIPESEGGRSFSNNDEWGRYVMRDAALQVRRRHGCVVAWMPKQEHSLPQSHTPYGQETRRMIYHLREEILVDKTPNRLVVGGHPSFPEYDQMSKELEVIHLEICYTQELLVTEAILLAEQQQVEHWSRP